MDDETLLHLKQSFACPAASQVHGGAEEKTRGAQRFQGLHCKILTRRKMEAPN
jgi:hypothetical protein